VQQVFAISSPIIKYKGLSVDVKLPQSLWYSNQVGKIQSIAIDFGKNEGFIEMPFEQVYMLRYERKGIYNWIYKMTLIDGQVLYSHSKMIFDETYTYIPWNERFHN
jgi:hypothetical protein